jgi:integrase/recombinase XerD
MKHKAILTTIYGLGLRISELINLKITDIDSDRMIVIHCQRIGLKTKVMNILKNT